MAAEAPGKNLPCDYPYLLSKTLLRLKISTDESRTGAPHVEVLKAIVPESNTKGHECLNLQKNDTTDSRIEVETTETTDRRLPSLLVRIGTARDQALDPGKLRANFLEGANGKPFLEPTNGKPAGGATVLDLEFDPFDPARVSQASKLLRGLGVCVVINALDPPNEGRAKQCEKPITSTRGNLLSAKQRSGSNSPATGVIYYRPREDYRVQVYVRDMRRPKDRWRLHTASTIPFEHASPLAIKIDPILIAKQSASLTFDNGMLVGAEIQRDESLELFLSDPANPAKAIKVTINKNTGAAALIAAQRELLRRRAELTPRAKSK